MKIADLQVIPFRVPLAVRNLLGRWLGLDDLERVYERVRAKGEGASIAARRDVLLVGTPWRDYAVRKNDGVDPPVACVFRRAGGARFDLVQTLAAYSTCVPAEETSTPPAGHASGRSANDDGGVEGSSAHRVSVVPEPPKSSPVVTTFTSSP